MTVAAAAFVIIPATDRRDDPEAPLAVGQPGGAGGAASRPGSDGSYAFALEEPSPGTAPSGAVPPKSAPDEPVRGVLDVAVDGPKGARPTRLRGRDRRELWRYARSAGLFEVVDSAVCYRPSPAGDEWRCEPSDSPLAEGGMR